MKTIVTVILYNKSIEDSLTINSLKKINYVDYELYIINNGPKEINFDLFKNSSFCRAIKKISFSEYLNNKPLSHIYNNVLNDNDSKRFIFLDDDSLIDHDFFYLINKDYERNPNVDLQVPVITDIKTKKIFYPRYNGQLLKENYVHLSSDKYLFHSIGSGLVIYRSLVDKFKQKYTEIFDPRFALYGVDVSLFRRIKFLEKKGQAINLHVISNIYHSLSRTEKVMSRWRYLERLYDELLTTKHYSKNIFTKLYSLLKIIVKDILYYKFKNMGLICKVYISGKHPRC